MPITQDRLAALLDAATDWRAVAEKYGSLIRSAHAMNADCADLALLAGLEPTRMLADPQSATILALESERIARTHRRNTRRRKGATP